MSEYKIGLSLNYNEIFVELNTSYITVDKKLAKKIANNMQVILVKEGFYMISHFIDNRILIKDDDKKSYQFQICTKDITPVDPSKLSPKELKDLLTNPNFMTGPEDYKNVDWTISNVYSMLRKEYPKKDRFKFDCLAYSVEIHKM